jgi:hypothetical protein
MLLQPGVLPVVITGLDPIGADALRRVHISLCSMQRLRQRAMPAGLVASFRVGLDPKPVSYAGKNLCTSEPQSFSLVNGGPVLLWMVRSRLEMLGQKSLRG